MTADELLAVLICPATRERLLQDGEFLRNESGSQSYPLIDGIPDLRQAPERLLVDADWYEPWEDLDRLHLAFPDPLESEKLPYHLDRYLASIAPQDGRGRWILEIGCGERQSEKWFTDLGYRYLGTDIDRRGIGPNVLADGHNLPVADESMDYCTSMAVLEHVVSPYVFAREVYRVLKPGGVFFGSAAFMYGYHDRASFHHMSHAGLMYILHSAGLEVEQMWPDWKYQDSVSSWGYRGTLGAPWKLAAKSALSVIEWTYTRLSNLARKLAGKEPIDLLLREISMAGSISFKARKPDQPVNL